MYERHSSAELEPILNLIRRGKKEPINGISVGISSLRLRTFAFKGTKCASCGLIATHFAVERDKAAAKNNKSYHINLYGRKEYGIEVLFTHDHILARSLGGLDALDNTQTMCSPCNSKKSVWEHRELERRRKILQKELCNV